MKGNFTTSTYNRKSSTVVKKAVRWIFIEINQYLYLIQSGKISNSTYNRTSTYNRNLRVLRPNRKNHKTKQINATPIHPSKLWQEFVRNFAIGIFICL